MPYLILGVGLLLGLYFLGRWFVAANPADVRKVATWGGIALIVAVAGFLLFTGRAGVAGAVLAFAIPFLIRLYRSRQGARVANGGFGRGRTSTVSTTYLDMALNHESGALDGEILAGRFEGRRLSELDLDELVALLGEASADEQSRRILEAYLDRRYGPDWRTHQSGGGGGGSGGGSRSDGRMSVEEAREILGVAPEATNEEIEAAYRAAIKRNHPDAGGSTWLAAKINEARKLLLG